MYILYIICIITGTELTVSVLQLLLTPSFLQLSVLSDRAGGRSKIQPRQKGGCQVGGGGGGGGGRVTCPLLREARKFFYVYEIDIHETRLFFFFFLIVRIANYTYSYFFIYFFIYFLSPKIYPGNAGLRRPCTTGLHFTASI